jgi:hypothetical protein
MIKIKSCTPVMILFLLFPAMLTAQEKGTDKEVHMPGLEEMAEGWNTMKPGGETACAHGTEYEFYTRVADPEKLLVYLYGGGGCWDAEGCRQGSEIYYSDIPAGNISWRAGILDSEHPENPFIDYTHVAIPVCTGDSHLGDRDAVYTLENDQGEETQFTIYHRGLTNALSAINWVTSNFESPVKIFVSGSSAGSIGVPFHASLLANHYPGVSVVGLGDDAGSYGDESASGADLSQWGLPEVLQRYSGWESYGAKLGITENYITAATSTENLSLYQVDHAHDRAQNFFLELTGIKHPNVLDHILANQEIIRSEVPGFRSFISGGYHHTMLNTSGKFYSYHVNGHRLRDWVAAIERGEEVPNVECSNCTHPQFIYDGDDLAVIDTAIDHLTNSGRWNPNDEGDACQQDSGMYSLRCAFFIAVDQVSDQPAGMHAVFWDLLNELNSRTEQMGENPFILYNNDSGRTADDIRELLEKIHQRVDLGLTGTIE